MSISSHFIIVVAMLLVVVLCYIKSRELIKQRWLKRLVNGSLMVVVIILIVSVVCFPNLSSIKTTGKYHFQSTIVEMTDYSRNETFSEVEGFRKLPVLVYYPVIEKNSNSRFPLIVFSHGGISTKTSNQSLYQELASHGYVVVSIDHTYHALSTQIGTKRIYIDADYMQALNTEDSHQDLANSLACYQQWMQLRTGDINFVIDSLVAKADKKNDGFYALIDRQQIGVAGHSLGGSAALGVARQRTDIKAVMALESPFLYDITGYSGQEFTWDTRPYETAIMNIYSDSGYPLVETDNKYRQNKNYLYNQGNVEYYYIQGSNHYSLTDLVRQSPLLCALLGGGYSKSGYVTLEIINQKSVAFFDKYLKGIK